MASMYSMPTLSSLELMLEKIQQLENEPGDVPPPLPVRPVSKARLPSRPRKLLTISLKSTGADEQIKRLEDTRQGKIQGAVAFQRCFRAYQARRYYNELKSSVISLQSFIRGENARKAYQQVHDKNSSDIKDHTWIPYAYFVNLKSQVLRSEANIRNKEAENDALRKEISEYEKRWMEYEAKMMSMEKMWQDQLTSMQMRLAAAKKGVAIEKTMRKSQRFEGEIAIRPTPNGTHYRRSHGNFPGLQVNSSRANSISNVNNDHGIALYDVDDENFFRVKSERWISNKEIGEEFQELDSKFDAWKRGYEIKLEEAKARMKRLGPANTNTQRSGKRWWRL